MAHIDTTVTVTIVTWIGLNWAHIDTNVTVTIVTLND